MITPIEYLEAKIKELGVETRFWDGDDTPFDITRLPHEALRVYRSTSILFPDFWSYVTNKIRYALDNEYILADIKRRRPELIEQYAENGIDVYAYPRPECQPRLQEWFPTRATNLIYEPYNKAFFDRGVLGEINGKWSYNRPYSDFWEDLSKKMKNMKSLCNTLLYIALAINASYGLRLAHDRVLNKLLDDGFSRMEANSEANAYVDSCEVHLVEEKIEYDKRLNILQNEYHF